MLLRNYKYRKLLKLANKKYVTENFNETIDLLLFANNMKIGNSSLYSVLGNCYTELKNYSKALEYVGLALQFDPNNLNYLYQEIHVLNKCGQCKKALLKLSELPSDLLDEIRAEETKAWILFELKEFNQAKTIYGNLLDRNKTNGSYHICIAECYKELGRLDKYIEYSELAVRIDGNNPIAKNNLGYILIANKDYDRAIKNLKEAISLDPKFAFAHNNLGYAMLKTGDKNLAFNLIKRSIELDNQNSYAYKNLAKYYIEESKNDLAIKNLKKAKELGYAEMYDNEVNDLLEELKKRK